MCQLLLEILICEYRVSTKIEPPWILLIRRCMLANDMQWTVISSSIQAIENILDSKKNLKCWSISNSWLSIWLFYFIKHQVLSGNLQRMSLSGKHLLPCTLQTTMYILLHCLCFLWGNMKCLQVLENVAKCTCIFVCIHEIGIYSNVATGSRYHAKELPLNWMIAVITPYILWKQFNTMSTF